MNCKEIQDVILTDYWDGEMEESQRKSLQDHLSVCADCRAFEVSGRKAVFDPFVRAEKISPPDDLWQNINKKITPRQDPFWAQMIETIQTRARFALFYARWRPAWVLIILAVVSISIFRMNARESGQYAEVEYGGTGDIEYLAGFDDEVMEEYSPDLGTDIEQYFL